MSICGIYLKIKILQIDANLARLIQNKYLLLKNKINLLKIENSASRVRN